MITSEHTPKNFDGMTKMADLFLSCIGKVIGGLIEVRSPSIGRVRMFVEKGQWIVPKQVIALLTRMNNQFFLLAPQDCEGKVIDIQDQDFIISLNYGEKFLVVEKITHTNVSNEMPWETSGISIDAPMDGMFFLSPSPNDAPFISIGDEISPGQTIGLIEVMKCFYPLVYHGQNRAKVVAINVKNGSPVSAGDTLITVS